MDEATSYRESCRISFILDEIQIQSGEVTLAMSDE
jgi:hypothetical protein